MRRPPGCPSGPICSAGPPKKCSYLLEGGTHAAPALSSSARARAQLQRRGALLLAFWGFRGSPLGSPHRAAFCAFASRCCACAGRLVLRVGGASPTFADAPRLIPGSPSPHAATQRLVGVELVFKTDAERTEQQCWSPRRTAWRCTSTSSAVSILSARPLKIAHSRGRARDGVLVRDRLRRRADIRGLWPPLPQRASASLRRISTCRSIRRSPCPTCRHVAHAAEFFCCQ